MRASLIAVMLAFVCLSTGCFGNEVTPFPDGLEPLEENMLAPPGTPAEMFPEEFVLEATPGGRYDVLLGRGFIRAPLVQVWEAYRNPAVGADRRTAPDWMSMDVDEGYDFGYIIQHITYDIVTVEWDVTWRHGVVEGTVDAPEVVAMRWQKTNGSSLIRTIEGSIVLRPVAEGSITEVELAYRANATGADTSTFLGYMQDVYNDAVAVTHGDPLPTFE